NGAGNAAQTAQDGDEQDLEGEHEPEEGGVDGDDEVAHQGAADAGHKGADHKDGDLMLKEVDAHGLGGGLVVPDCLEGSAKAAGDHGPGQDNHDQGNSPTPVEIGVGGNALEAQGAVGDALGVGKHHPDDFGKAQGGNGQIIPPQFQGRGADDKSHQ